MSRKRLGGKVSHSIEIYNTQLKCAAKGRKKSHEGIKKISRKR